MQGLVGSRRYLRCELALLGLSVPREHPPGGGPAGSCQRAGLRRSQLSSPVSTRQKVGRLAAATGQDCTACSSPALIRGQRWWGAHCKAGAGRRAARRGSTVMGT